VQVGTVIQIVGVDVEEPTALGQLPLDISMGRGEARHQRQAEQLRQYHSGDERIAVCLERLQQREQATAEDAQDREIVVVSSLYLGMLVPKSGKFPPSENTANRLC